VANKSFARLMAQSYISAMEDIKPGVPEFTALASWAASAPRAQALAPTCRGLNRSGIDKSLQSLLQFYMERPLLAHLPPYLDELGELAGDRLHDQPSDATALEARRYEEDAIDLLLADAPVTLGQATPLLVA
jgi:hypothetical protein